MNIFALIGTLFLIFRLIVSLFLILFITPQTSVVYYNFVVLFLDAADVFVNYAQAKQYVFAITWTCISAFILLNLVTVF